HRAQQRFARCGRRAGSRRLSGHRRPRDARPRLRRRHRAGRGRRRVARDLSSDRAYGRGQLHRADVRRGRARRPRVDPRRVRGRPGDRHRPVTHAARASLPAPERRRLHRLPARALSAPPGPVRPAPARGLMDHTLGGPEMAPQTPPRSSRPGKTGMLLDLVPIALVVLARLALTLLLRERYPHPVLPPVFSWAALGWAAASPAASGATPPPALT